MSKELYTEEEVKKVFKTLFTEKKKVKELQNKLEQIEEERSHLRQQLEYVEQSPPVTHKKSSNSLDDKGLEEKLDSLQTGQKASLKISHLENELTAEKQKTKRLKQAVLVMKRKLESGKSTSNDEELEKAQETLQALNEQLAVESRTNRQFSHENGELKKQLNENAEQLRQLSIELELKKQPSPDFVREEKLEKELRELKQELAEVQKEKNTFKEELDSSQQALTLVKEELVEVYHKYDPQGDESREGIHASLNEKVQFTENLNSLQGELKTNQALVEDLTNTIEQKDKLYAQTKRQVDSISRELHKRDQEIAALKEFEYSYRQLSHQKRDLEIQLDQHRKEFKDLYTRHEAAVRQLQDSHSKETTQASSLTELNEALVTGQEKLKKTSELYEELKLSQSSLKENYEKALSESHHLRQEKHRLAVELSQCSGQLSLYAEEVQVIKQTLVRGVRESKALEEKLLQTVSEKLQLHKQVERARQELGEEYQKRKELQEQLADSLQALSESQKYGLSTEQAQRSLQAHISALEESKKQLEKQLEEGKEEYQLIEQKYLESEQIISQLSVKITELSAIEEEKYALEELHRETIKKLDKASEISETLQQSVHRVQQELTNTEQEKTNLESRNQYLEEERLSLQEKAQEQTEQINALYKQLREAESIEDQRKQLEEQYQDLRAEYEEQAEQLEEAFHEHADLSNQLKSKVEQREELERSMEELGREKKSLDTTLKETQERVKELESLLDEKDSHLTTAQQHLAKKVKENAIYHEQLEEQKHQIAELKSSLSHHKNKVEELQKHVGQQREQEQKLQGLLNENIKSSESRIKEWEGKYLKVLKKQQDAEGKVKDLRKLETEYHKLHALLANLNQYIGHPAGIGSLSSIPPMSPQGVPQQSLEVPDGEGSEVQFDTSSSQEIKNSLDNEGGEVVASKRRQSQLFEEEAGSSRKSIQQSLF